MDLPPSQPPSPSPNGGQSGRGPGGRFAKGNPGGPGNPHAAQVGKLRGELLKEMKGSDVALAIKTMREVMKNSAAKDSDRLRAAELLLERALGKPIEADLLERMEDLEQRFTEMLTREGGRR